MRRTERYAAVAALFCTCSALAFDPPILKGENGTMTIEFNGNRIGDVSEAVSKAFGEKVCAEDFGIINPANKELSEREPEDGGPVREGNIPLTTGMYTAASAEEMLDSLTAASRYTWMKSNTCYVIYPRKGSLLMERITLSVPPCTLLDAVRALLDSDPTDAKQKELITASFMSTGGPRPSPVNVNTVGTLTFVDTPLVDALCRVVEAADPSASEGGIFIWQLCSGWAKQCRIIDVQWIASTDAARKKDR